MKLSYKTKDFIHKLLHPFKHGFWCQMCIGKAYYDKHLKFGMLWEEWDSYAGDGDGGYSYLWTNNRKTWKQLRYYTKFGIDDEGFVFILPFFITWLLVLPGTIYNNYRIEKEIAESEKFYRTHCFDENTMTWEEKNEQKSEKK